MTKTKITFSAEWPPRWLMVLYGAVILGLTPWIVTLWYSLPTQHLSSHWNVTWVGFDLALLVTLVMTVALGYRRSAWIIMPAMALAVLLVTDAWFDIMSAAPGPELTWALITGLAAELPLATVSLWLVIKTMRRLTAGKLLQ